MSGAAKTKNEKTLFRIKIQQDRIREIRWLKIVMYSESGYLRFVQDGFAFWRHYHLHRIGSTTDIQNGLHSILYAGTYIRNDSFAADLPESQHLIRDFELFFRLVQIHLKVIDPPVPFTKQFLHMQIH